jgi:Skp family chaperone for outer membrane proteins
MKVSAVALCLALLAGACWAQDSRVPTAAPSGTKPTKKQVVVVVIDMAKVVRESSLSKSVQAEFQSWTEGVKAALQPRADTIRAKQDALKNDEGKLNADQKQTREKEIALLQAELNQLQQKVQQDYQTRQQMAEERLRSAFDPVVDALAKEFGWDIILNKSERMVWNSDAVDQTDLVLARFNAAAPAPAAAPAQAPAK